MVRHSLRILWWAVTDFEQNPLADQQDLENMSFRQYQPETTRETASEVTDVE
jgi:hypothetical protein